MLATPRGRFHPGAALRHQYHRPSSAKVRASSILPQSRAAASMAGRLAAAPDGSANANGSAAPDRARGFYRDRIRRVAVSGGLRRSALFDHSQSGHSGSGYSNHSGASNSYPSNNSGISAAEPDFGAHELTVIAIQMVSDGYAQRMVREFCGGGGLENWFLELDVGWVLQIHNKTDLCQQLQLQLKSPSWLQDFVERWIRALMITISSIVEALDKVQTLLLARFGKASISEMLVFVDAVIPLLKAGKLRAVLDMYICVCTASYMFTLDVFSLEAQIIFDEIRRSLGTERNKLCDAISTTVEEVRALMEDDDSWAIEFPQGGAGVHRNTRLMVGYIVSMTDALVSTRKSAPSHNTGNLHGLIDDTIKHLKDLLPRKSELCLDAGMRYLFLLNNSYFIATRDFIRGPYCGDSQHHQGLELTLECKDHMDSYLDVSWAHVISSISKSNPPGPLRRWMTNTSSLAKFESAFHQTYQAQKLWKVPDPQLKDALRRAIIERVISSYNDYLKKHPELAEHARRGNSTPAVLEEMLGQLFEG
ncbi:exocyst complex component EXO70E2-like [Triticum urartu]|nr:exocyst complex component EXO70E2-like [Triticum urartu]